METSSVTETARTEGGEALTNNATIEIGQLGWKTETTAADAGSEGLKKWYVLWTRSHSEQLVYDQLAAKGFHLFLPKMEVRSSRGGIRHLSRIPMFPGYLLLRHAMDTTSYVEVRKARGLVRILGERFDRLAVIPDEEIEAIRRVSRSNLLVLPYPYLREGQRVRITRGPLAEVEGILVQIRPNKGLLVLSINLLERSVAVEVDCAAAVPA